MSACLGECMCLFNCEWLHGCILGACMILIEGFMHGCLAVLCVCGSYDCVMLPSLVLPSHPDLQGSAVLRHSPSSPPSPLVPQSALTVSQPMSDWTGSKGFLSLSVFIFHIDLNDSYTLTTAAPSVELTSAFTSAQTVSLHTQTCVKDPLFWNQHWIPRNWHFQCNSNFNVIWPFIYKFCTF